MNLFQLFLVPFELNRTWTVNKDANFIETNSVFSVMVNKTDRPQEIELILIEHKILGRNDYYTEIITFKPYQGIVKVDKKHSGRVIPINESWELVESNIK